MGYVWLIVPYLGIWDRFNPLNNKCSDGHNLRKVWAWPQERRRRREKNKENKKIKENIVIVSLCVYIL